MADIRIAVIREQHKAPRGKKPTSSSSASPATQPTDNLADDTQQHAPAQSATTQRVTPTQLPQNTRPKQPRRTPYNAPRSKRTVQSPPVLIPIIISPINPTFQLYSPLATPTATPPPPPLKLTHPTLRQRPPCQPNNLQAKSDPQSNSPIHMTTNQQPER